MSELKADIDPNRLLNEFFFNMQIHSSCNQINEKLKKWLKRFPFSLDDTVFSDLALLSILAPRKFLDYHSPNHCFRLILGIYQMQKKILKEIIFAPDLRHLEIRCRGTNLIFPFARKPVLGCLISFNVMDRYEIFDEENIILALKKYQPELKLVPDSFYTHTSQHKKLKIFYFEIEKKNGESFSLLEKNNLQSLLKEKIKKSIQPLSPAIFTGLNNEETHKKISILNKEIHSIHDLPQGYIALVQQTGEEIIFRVTLVYVSPSHRFSLKERFYDSHFVSERFSIVRNIENHPIHAHIFRLHLARDPTLLRSDGSLDFYQARQKIVSLIINAVGEFCDYNGGFLIKQQPLLQKFKEKFTETSNQNAENQNAEFLETFFYAITPLEQRAEMDLEILSSLFTYFQKALNEKLLKDSLYSLTIHRHSNQIFITIKGEDSSFSSIVSEVIQDYSAMNITYCFINVANEIFFNCVLTDSHNPEGFIEDLRVALKKYRKKAMNRQVLRIGLDYSISSLDPRIGGENISSSILKLLFEGLTRFDRNGNIENAVAETIEISSNLKEYVFHLGASLWNDESPVSAYDFEYAWKKILSPEFDTAFAHFFYAIKNAKEAKEGIVSLDEVGIKVINHRTLKVELAHPTPYFLQLVAHSIYSPIHQQVDLKYPQWPYQSEKKYPCNGPFQLKINQPKHGFELIKNPLYKEVDQITWDQIVLTQMNSTQAFQAFQKDEVDWIGNPFGAWDPLYSQGEKDNVTSFPDSWVCWLLLNTSTFPFNNFKMRQAFAYGINRSQIIKEASLPLNPAFSPLLSHYLENRNALFPDFDDNAARQLFEEGLQELNLKRENLPPFILIYHGAGIQKSTAISLKKQFQEIFGIECEIKSLPWNVLFKKLTKEDFQMGLMHWISLVNDSSYTLNAFRFSKYSMNLSRWDSAEFQYLMDLSDKEANPFVRSAHLLQAEQAMSKEMPLIPLFYQPYQALVRKKFHINYYAPCGQFNVVKSHFKQEK